jgi:hypothetical protein
MSTVQDDLTKVQELLHDSGTIWTAAELLRAFNDGYRRLLQGSASIKVHAAFDIPPRHAMTFCYEWEDTYGSGPMWMCMLGAKVGRWRCTTRWEAQQSEHVGELLTDAITTTAEYQGITQQWERFNISGDADRNYDLVFPRNINSPSRVRFNNAIMLPISTLELDQVHLNWPSFVGMPYWWTAGTGRVQSIEIYRIQTDYTQAYQLTYPQYYESVGMPRYWSGSRTYAQDLTAVSASNSIAYTTSADAQVLATVRPKAETIIGMAARITLYQATDTGLSFCMQPWEYDTLTAASTIRTGGTVGCFAWSAQLTVIVGSNTTQGADAIPFAVGMPRQLSSPDRQYLPVMRGSGVMTVTGTIREWGSSDGNFFVTYNAINQSDLGVNDAPDLLPSQISKYLRYYVLWQAFGRQGEGYREDLAEHWYQRFERGAKFMRKIADVAYTDHIYVREEVGQQDTRRVPHVQLPPQFERIW